MSPVYDQLMRSARITEKLRFPEIRADSVLRPRLLERLIDGLVEGDGFSRKTTLLAAPAGFGKTCLLGEWARMLLDREPSLGVAWLSLGAEDADPAQFLRDLAAALGALIPDLVITLGELETRRSPLEGRAIIALILNELACANRRVVLALDDYHLAAGPGVDPLFASLLDRLPPIAHVALATRSESGLPLPRLRARGQVAEFRAEDLRFTEEESGTFLRRIVGESVSHEGIAALSSRTEGWVVGLRLAAISLKGRKDAEGFIRSFAGSDRRVLDYLIEDVLAREPETTRDFLYRTSILERLCAPLCEAVAGPGSGRSLHSVERANLFIVPLDDRRAWFRYHRLFAEALRERLSEESPEELPSLHRRASAWLEREGYPEEAVSHALEAGDHESAARLLEALSGPMDEERRSARWLEWARRLPDEVIGSWPVLSVGVGWALLDQGELEMSERRFRDAEHPRGEPRAADASAYESLPASIAVARAYRALAEGDGSAAVSGAEAAIALASPSESRWRTAGFALLGLARLSEGDLVPAEKALVESMDITRRAGRASDSAGIAFLLADLRIALGRLCDAEDAYRSSILQLEGREADLMLAGADLRRGMGEVLLERGRLAEAAAEFEAARACARLYSPVDWRYRLAIAESRLALARGAPGEALETLEEAARFRVRTPLPDLRPGDALRARAWIRLGDAPRALAWAGREGLRADSQPRFLDEYAYATLAKALVARFEADGEGERIRTAVGMLERLVAAAERGARLGNAVEYLAALALARDAEGDGSAALEALKRAVSLAEPEGYALAFIGEGPRMGRLLARLRATSAPGLVRGYVGRLLHAERAARLAPDPLLRGARGTAPLEPLSERELEVLRLLKGELSGPEIARALYISLNTLRTHTRSIFLKLDVNSRRGAVRRAAELGLD